MPDTTTEAYEYRTIHVRKPFIFGPLNPNHEYMGEVNSAAGEAWRVVSTCCVARTGLLVAPGSIEGIFYTMERKRKIREPLNVPFGKRVDPRSEAAELEHRLSRDAF